MADAWRYAGVLKPAVLSRSASAVYFAREFLSCVGAVVQGTAGTPACKYVFADGATYVGEWKGVKKEGRGKYVFADGDIYEGEWKAGQMEGRGFKLDGGVWNVGTEDTENSKDT